MNILGDVSLPQNSSRTILESRQEALEENAVIQATPTACPCHFFLLWMASPLLPSSTNPSAPSHRPPLRPTQLELITSSSESWPYLPSYTCNLQKLDELSRYSPPGAFGGAQPAHALILDSWPPELKENKFLLFQVTKSVVIR